MGMFYFPWLDTILVTASSLHIPEAMLWHIRQERVFDAIHSDHGPLIAMF